MKHSNFPKSLIVILVVIMCLTIVLGSTVFAEDKKKVAIVTVSPIEHWLNLRDNAIKALAQKGFKDGENIEITKINLEGDINRCDAAINQIKALKPDVLISDGGSFSSQKIIKPLENSGIQIILAQQVEDKKLDFIDSMEKPGRNITGIKTMPSNLQESAFRLLNQITPIKGKKAVFVTFPINFNQEDTKKALAKNGIELKAYVESSCFEDMQKAVLKYENDREVGWVLLGVGAFVTKDGKPVQREEIFDFELTKHKKPSITYWEQTVQAGCLVALAVDIEELGFQSGVMASRILNGEKAANMTIEDPEKVTICLNQKRAQMMGIEIPTYINSSASRIYTDFEGHYIKQKK